MDKDVPSPSEKQDLLTEFKARYESYSRKALKLLPDERGLVWEGGTRVGGPAFIPSNLNWPIDLNGNEMEFIAQIDFSQVSELEGYPTSGILQFFIAMNGEWGDQYFEPKAADFAVRWIPEIGDGKLVQQPDHHVELFKEGDPISLGSRREQSPLSIWARNTGIPLRPMYSFFNPPSISNWFIDDIWNKLVEQNIDDDIFEYLAEKEKYLENCHHIGGYPDFPQQDPRNYGDFKDHDIVLLSLTSDGHIIWGDYGSAAFLITKEALLAKDFNDVLYTAQST